MHLGDVLKHDGVKMFLTLDWSWTDFGRYSNPVKLVASLQWTRQALDSTSDESMIQQGHMRKSSVKM